MWGFHELLSGFKNNFPSSQIILQILENYFKTATALYNNPTFYVIQIFLAQNMA